MQSEPAEIKKRKPISWFNKQIVGNMRLQEEGLHAEQKQTEGIKGNEHKKIASVNGATSLDCSSYLHCCKKKGCWALQRPGREKKVKRRCPASPFRDVEALSFGGVGRGQKKPKFSPPG